MCGSVGGLAETEPPGPSRQPHPSLARGLMAAFVACNANEYPARTRWRHRVPCRTRFDPFLVRDISGTAWLLLWKNHSVPAEPARHWHGTGTALARLGLCDNTQKGGAGASTRCLLYLAGARSPPTLHRSTPSPVWPVPRSLCASGGGGQLPPRGSPCRRPPLRRGLHGRCGVNIK